MHTHRAIDVLTRGRATIAALLLVLLTTVDVEAVAIERVALLEKSADAFTDIREYFDPEGGERTGRRWIARTDPDKRAGLYFVVRISESNEERASAPALGSVVIHVIDAEAPDDRATYTFPAESWSREQSRSLWLGLTGEQRPKRRASISAWKVEIRAQSGDVLAEAESFAWSLPSE